VSVLFFLLPSKRVTKALNNLGEFPKELLNNDNSIVSNNKTSDEEEQNNNVNMELNQVRYATDEHGRRIRIVMKLRRQPPTYLVAYSIDVAVYILVNWLFISVAYFFDQMH
jgi:hypothetical protein